MEELGGTRVHKVMLGNRRTCTISGVNDVLSFDIREILLETEQGMLMIKGDDLHVNRLTLDKGEVDVDGKIDSLTYSDVGSGNTHTKGESFFSKLFR
ncbi:MAG: sporulation protein YabP [Lachnospiraceae bacterium]|nr:sporulation protein YabP [Lachnospiraceae bacterium]